MANSKSEELSMKILQKLVGAMPELEVNLPRQLEIKSLIDEVIYQYDITCKETALVTSDIYDKAKLYLACKKLEGLSDNTLYNYALELRQFAEYFHKPVSMIDSMDIRMYMNNKSEKRAEATINTKMTCIRDFFQWMQNEEYIISNPTKKVKPVKEPVRERHPIPDSEIEIIRESLTDARDKAIFEFLLSTGCRAHEVVSVKVNDINWDKMSLYVIGKGNKERKVLFNERTKVVLRKYLDTRRGSSEYLFCSLRAPFKPLSNRALELIVKSFSNNYKLFPHLFRHSYATRALNAGMPLEIVQELLGHSNVSTTQVYAKTNEKNVEHEYRKLL